MRARAKGVASEESAQEAQEEAAVEGAEELGEEFYVEAFGDVMARIRHGLVSNFTGGWHTQCD